ncbi:MAG TPA: DNA alkylation repair protein [Bacteroidia bacterium]|jgi:3-methyladenine DNA glycosylase AlkD|nr:DNA alkylation repair protein [Bacteroidia bacterium]
MTSKEILSQLKTMGSESTKKVLVKHGAKEPFYGVKVGDLKTIVKKVKVNHTLALELYDSGISDAMYLAGLIADDSKMTKKNLQDWIKKAYWYMLSEYTVPWVAAGSMHGHELAKEWIESKDEKTAAAGWVTYSCLLAIKDDKELDMKEIKSLVDRIQKDIHKSPNRVRHTMNNFIISVGGYIAPLSEHAIAAAKKIGTVQVNMGDTACKVPSAPAYIEKMKERGSFTKKKKTVKC